MARRDVGVGGLSVVGVLAERQCQREDAGVPGKPLPAGAHRVTDSVPVFPNVAPADAAFVDPSAPEELRNPDPADRIPMPDVRAVPPRAVRTALVNGVPRAIDRRTVVEQALSGAPVHAFRADRPPASPLPRLLSA